MGKNNLILGTGRGKLGDIVFYRTGGEQRFRTRVRPTNPRTNAQLLQRCVVSTAVKFYSEVSYICDHAFQNYIGPLKNHQRFMKLNIDRLRKVALKNIISFNPIRYNEIELGNWVDKNSPNIAINSYQVSEGDIQEPATSRNGEKNYIWFAAPITKPWNEITYNDVAKTLNVNIGDQITLMLFKIENGTGFIENTQFGRIILYPNEGNGETKFFTSEQEINSPNKENYGDLTVIPLTDADTKRIAFARSKEDYTFSNYAWAVIVSRFENNTWKRSSSFVHLETSFANMEPLSTAIMSYKKASTSSLYLNQSEDGEELNDLTTRISEEELEIYTEEKNKKTKK